MQQQIALQFFNQKYTILYLQGFIYIKFLWHYYFSFLVKKISYEYFKRFKRFNVDPILDCKRAVKYSFSCNVIKMCTPQVCHLRV